MFISEEIYVKQMLNDTVFWAEYGDGCEFLIEQILEVIQVWSSHIVHWVTDHQPQLLWWFNLLKFLKLI